MNLLLDTCTLLWWWSEPKKLSKRIYVLLKDKRTEVWVSSASAWETATKHRIGKYPAARTILDDWLDRLRIDNFKELAITSPHALMAGTIVCDHRDPFDRMIAAQGIIEQVPVATPDPAFDRLGAERIW